MDILKEKVGQSDGIRRLLANRMDDFGNFVLSYEDVEVVLSEIDFLRELVRELRDEPGRGGTRV